MRVSRRSSPRPGVRGRTASPERFVLTVRTELTNRMLIYGQPHLRRVLALCAVHYNARRPHRALQLRPPRPEALVPKPVHGPIRRRPVLGGLINEYEPAA
jgi:putative transposase